MADTNIKIKELKYLPPENIVPGDHSENFVVMTEDNGSIVIYRTVQDSSRAKYSISLMAGADELSNADVLKTLEQAQGAYMTAELRLVTNNPITGRDDGTTPPDAHKRFQNALQGAINSLSPPNPVDRVDHKNHAGKLFGADIDLPNVHDAPPDLPPGVKDPRSTLKATTPSVEPTEKTSKSGGIRGLLGGESNPQNLGDVFSQQHKNHPKP